MELVVINEVTGIGIFIYATIGYYLINKYLRVSSIHAKLCDLATKFKNGEITEMSYIRQSLNLIDKIYHYDREDYIERRTNFCEEFETPKNNKIFEETKRDLSKTLKNVILTEIFGKK